MYFSFAPPLKFKFSPPPGPNLAPKSIAERRASTTAQIAPKISSAGLIYVDPFRVLGGGGAEAVVGGRSAAPPCPRLAGFWAFPMARSKGKSNPTISALCSHQRFSRDFCLSGSCNLAQTHPQLAQRAAMPRTARRSSSAPPRLGDTPARPEPGTLPYLFGILPAGNRSAFGRPPREAPRGGHAQRLAIGRTMDVGVALTVPVLLHALKLPGDVSHIILSFLCRGRITYADAICMAGRARSHRISTDRFFYPQAHLTNYFRRIMYPKPDSVKQFWRLVFPSSDEDWSPDED